ncbi:MAG TPA: hypothetical protein VFX61_01405 [Micromonosporaceae bacterium]|nr:hypothetical protein [Micromonosporaceae bacterium]
MIWNPVDGNNEDVYVTGFRRLARGPVSRSGRPLLILAAALLLGGCGASAAGPAAPTPDPSESVVPAETERPAHAQLAALAAAAEDRRFTGRYTLSSDGRTDRNIAVALAEDGSWRVDIQGGALSGTADVAIAQTSDGLFQCALPAPHNQIAPVCVRVGDPGGRIPAGIDPRVQHLFTSWGRVLSDRQAPLAVSPAQALPGAVGSCFSVESISASLQPPLEVGIYCYDPDGTLTAARVAFGTLVLAGPLAAAPPAITLPGPVVAGEPLRITGPPLHS